MPPRVYLQEEYLPQGTTLDDIQKIIPLGASIQKDETTLFKGSNYVEIATVSDEFSFREWARTPLGQYEGDKDYAELYATVYSPVNKGSLTGSIPGYWNYYGSMQYNYIDVDVTSVATGIENGKEVILGANSSDAPDDIMELIGARLTMNTVMDNEATNSAVMVDLLPTMSMYTQIFCDRLTLHNEDSVFFSGHPCKSSLRLVNAFRVTNQNMPFGGSGVFISSMLTSDMDDEGDAQIMRLFKKYAKDGQKLKGIFIYQVISEVEENRKVDYRRDGNIPNPAYSVLSGRIAPWYEGEMCSWTIARQLIGDQPYITGRNSRYDAPVGMMTPAQFKFDQEAGVLMLDFLNNFPIRNTAEGDGPFSPIPFEDNSYEVYPLGDIEIRLEDIDAEHHVTDSIVLGSIRISEDTIGRDQLYRDGGMYLISLAENNSLSNHNTENWNLSVYATANNNHVRIMTESPVVVTSDQAGLYCNQGDDPGRGYKSNSGNKEQCLLRIFDRGRPVKSPIDISFVEYKMSSSGALRTDSLYRIEKYADGDRVTFDTAAPRNAIYLFLPYRTHSLPLGGYPGAVVQTGFFVSLKVLLRHDYTKYLDPTNPEYPQKVTFQVLYDNLFGRFGLLTPTMNFHAERFNNPSMANEVLRRMHDDNWDKAWYMPATRDVSSDQVELVAKWAGQFDMDGEAVEEAAEPHKHSSSDKAHSKHLLHKTFFNK